MQKTGEDRAPAWNETRLGKALCPWIALVCLLGWLFCVLVLLPLFVGVLSIADLCRGRKPRLLAPDPDDVESIPVGSESTAGESWHAVLDDPGESDHRQFQSSARAKRIAGVLGVPSRSTPGEGYTDIGRERCPRLQDV
jgi:hypothetical protein